MPVLRGPLSLFRDGIAEQCRRVAAPAPAPAQRAAGTALTATPEPWLLAVCTLGLGAGGLLWLLGLGPPAKDCWMAVTALGMVMAAGWIVTSLRRREAGVDMIALLALGGALAVGEQLAGSVIAVMLASGRTLEAVAGRRARRELTGLLERAPRWAMRREDGEWVRRPIGQIGRGDRLLVRTGEVVPVDGVCESVSAVLDESALTGEPMPVEHGRTDPVRSGVVNAGPPFELRATTSAADSAYAGIMKMVAQAQAGTAPFVRLANRYAAFFVPATLVMAAVAWLASGSAVRAVAVLVIATPCPLILAAPVAIVGGLSRAAHRGVIVKDGSALERLAASRTLLLDKTGTLTLGQPSLIDVVTGPGEMQAEVLRLAASLDQASAHPLASSIVRAARVRQLPLAEPVEVQESPGQGIRGEVDGHRVAVGKASFAGPSEPRWAHSARRRAAREDAMTVFVGIDGATAGVLLFTDPIRPDAAATLRALRRCGIERIVLISGDRRGTAESVGAVLGVDQVLAERTPADKLDTVRVETARAPTLMVGDGINDAPALAAATVGAAMPGPGATASSEAADVVLAVDRLDRLAEAVQVAGRSQRIARQSVVAGIGLSFVGMVFAGAGLLPPVFGALAQEGIDVAVIAWALRALGPAPKLRHRMGAADAEVAHSFAAAHASLSPRVAELRELADAADRMGPREVWAAALGLHAFLRDTLYPHELAEERDLYPAVARVIGGDDPTGPMSRAHAEIGHQIRRLGRLLDEVGGDEPDEDDLREMRRLLYELHATLRLHFAQEEESYFTLADDSPAAAGRGQL